MNMKIEKIMIVDDNEFDCYITSKIINNLDESIDIMEFNSSLTAIQFLEEFQNSPEKLPNLIFLDIYMPVLDGFGFIEKFNTFSDVIKAHTKICILSTTVDDLYIHKAKINSSILYTSKPITNEFLQGIIK
ncbi:response regulator of ato, ornithine decarboxylase antizyme (sensor ATOS) [Flavobacteria bacterium BAL38]|uniref:response regulator n=1 Tax=Flavobacterium sp. TaxID=239 RepID=UPI0000F3948E|nr:response regulator of ato, ornithine decarboxylase antizyme (sensor ATOS) [Flavobacteria bacterium BAL38]MQP52002.1 response regulator [Flavobacterium sp. LMO9]MQP61871.1 response regulator [Flavobacterium sp. LMO6]